MSVWHGDSGTPKKRRPSSQPSSPIAQRDPAYRALVAELGLSDHHRDHLADVRGLPTSAVTLFATLPALTFRERKEIARAVAARTGQLVAGIPGFYKDGNAWALVPLPRDPQTGFVPASGFLVPVIDHLGRIQAMQLRADDVPARARRYTMVSSAKWQAGASSGVPVAVWRPDLKGAGSWLTEGPLKGLVASTRLDACVLATCGVANWRPALEVLAGAPRGYPVTIAYDVPDLTAVLEVWRAREDLALALHSRGFDVRIARWDGARAKGIDDAVLAGLAVDVQRWQRSLPPLIRPRGARLVEAIPA